MASADTGVVVAPGHEQGAGLEGHGRDPGLQLTGQTHRSKMPPLPRPVTTIRSGSTGYEDARDVDQVADEGHVVHVLVVLGRGGAAAAAVPHRSGGLITDRDAVGML